MHARFRTGNDAPIGVTAFLLVFVASMVMLVSPENVNDFTYVSAATVLALFILQITNIYSDSISRVLLYLPLDVHSGNMGRALGLLTRRQSDWRATEEITAALRRFDAEDPVRYDFSLFGAGIDGFLKQ